MSIKEAIVDLGGSRRRGSAPKAGSVWENRMKLDEVKGGIKVFENSQENTQDNNSVSNLNHSPNSQMDKKVIDDVLRPKQSPIGMSGKRKTWKPENSEGSPLQIAKQISELRKNLDQEFKELVVSKQSPVWIKKRRSIPFPSSDGHEKDAVQLRRVKSDSTEVMDHGIEKTEVKSEPIKKPDERIKNSDDVKVVGGEPNRDLEGYNGKIGKSPDGVEHSRSDQDCKDVSDHFHGMPRSRTNSRLQSFVDLVMWKDATKSAFIFGIGTFGIISSSYTNDLNISFISMVSYLGLVYLGAIFLFRSLIISRGSMDMDSSAKQDCVVGEEEAIWVVKLLLPYLNEFLLTLRALFSGDPATTMKVQGMHSDVSSLEEANIWREASRIVRGVRAFWKGNLVTVTLRLPYSSISFYAFEHCKNLLRVILGVESQGDNISADLCIRLFGGGLAGVTAASVTYPLDLVRTCLAAQTNVIYYRGIWHALRTISKEEGIFGLYKGLGATLLGVGPNLGISFSVYDTARSYWHLHRPEDSIVLVSLACGSLSGIAASTAVFNAFDAEADWGCRLLIAYPLDLVRRRMQLEGAGGRARL